ncbi:hypothetical protein RD792_003527 [Penstemon davidsonii]|uniref:Retrotransposon gag domain-containing protein n=1 Tax=Penstemon davidsonii TaxID=160366 RepID=A0ABR0DU24_9LAMI|nr:hypothetical protein RD792_003527 [Penstemon davidsonii]
MEGETLRQWLARFSIELLKVDTPQIEFLSSLMFELSRNSQFGNALCRKQPKSFERIMEIAEKYMIQEKMNKLKNAQNPRPPIVKKPDRAPIPKPSDYGGSNAQQRGSVWQRLKVYKPQAPTHRSNVYGRPASPDRAPRTEHEKSNFTRLNTSRDEILTVLEERNLVPGARRITQPSPGTMNHDKYCRYHRARGHSTEDCFQLKQEIEKLIAQGKLKEYVRKENHNSRYRSRSPRRSSEQHREDQQQAEDQTNRVINMISGGPVGGDSRNARKRTTIKD